MVRTDGAGEKKIRRDPAGVTGPFPLFNVRELLERSDAPVLVVEGEKTADAAAKLFPDYVVTTSLGGSGQATSTDWAPIAGREVVIWPDADAPGTKYAAEVEACVEAEVRTVELPLGLPRGSDLADPVPDGVDVRAILERRPVLPVLSLEDLYAEPDVEVDWLVEGLLPADGISLLVAPPKAGKSTLARCLAVAVADGRGRWLGRATKAGTVLHLALEERRATVRNHYRALKAPGNEIYALIGSAPPPDERMRLLRATVSALRPALVIVDPLFRYARIQDGNDYATTLAALEPFIALARNESTHVLLVHHAHKCGGDDGNEALGSTGLTASVDTFMSLARHAGERTLYAHGRDGVALEKIILSMDADGWIQASGTKRAADLHDVMRRILDLLKDSPEPLSRSAIQNQVGARKESILVALRNLMQNGDAEQIGSGPRTTYRTGTGIGSRASISGVGTAPIEGEHVRDR